MLQSLKIVTVVQTRTGSTRLPNKVMLPIIGKPLFVRMVERIQAAKLVGTVVVATTTEKQDDIIEETCHQENLPCFRGHPCDLLDRHYRAGVTYSADVLVKIPSDSPLIDPEIIDIIISTFLENPDAYDYVSNVYPATFPNGCEVEVMSMKALYYVWQTARNDFEREHTTPFFWKNKTLFRIKNVEWKTGLNYSWSHRWTVDYEEDYDFVKLIYEKLYEKYPLFRLDQILALLARHPEISAINEQYTGVEGYRHLLNERRKANLKTEKRLRTV
ncbi:acylneuraminate cytidylyltransferase [candidate division KSB1 bacterium]|nr:acylneuraminate cytidylyltransferase [candidate division KSB1 bacterium]